VAQGSVLAFLDDDAVASPRWLEEHVAGYQDSSVLGVGGDVVPLWRSDPPAWLPREFYWVIGCSYSGLPDVPAQIRNPIGANMSMRAETFADAGGFHDQLGRLDANGEPITGSADETEFCIRAAKRSPNGYWLYRPAASIRHVVTAERATWRYFVERCRLEGSSKAVLVGLCGQRSGLTSERRYLTRVLPRAVGREFSAAAKGSRGALARAGTICVGAAVTVGAFARARMEARAGHLPSRSRS